MNLEKIESVGQGLAPAVKKLLSFMLALTMLFTITAGIDLSAYAATSGDYEYEILDDGTIEITRYYGSDSNLSIPSTIDGKKVTSIGGEWAFYDCDNLTSVTIPNSVTSIGEWAFYDCDNLTNVTIPKSVTSITYYAFDILNDDLVIHCYYKSYAYRYALENYIHYKFISNEGIETINNYERKTVIFSESDFFDIYYYYSKKYFLFTPTDSGIYRINYPENSDSIYCSIYDSNMNSIDFFNEYDDDDCIDCTLDKGKSYYFVVSAFSYEEPITADNPITGNVSIGLKHDHQYLDCKCTICRMSEFNYTILADGTAEITGYLGSESSITIPSTINGHKVTSIGDWAFEECFSLTSITIPNSITRIGEDAFNYWKDGFVLYCYYGSYAHKYAEENGINYKFISNDGIETINEYEIKTITFSYEDEKHYLAFTPTESGTYTCECPGIVNYYIYDSDMNRVEETEIESSWYYNYTLEKGKTYYIVLQSYELFTCNVIIGLKHDHQYSNDKCTICGKSEYRYMFVDDRTIKITEYNGSESTVIIPSAIDGKKVTNIAGAFEGYTKLTSVTIPNTVTNIGYCAFWYCENLKSVTIPSSVTSIDGEAFHACLSLTDVYYDGTIKEWNEICIDYENEDLTNATIHCADGVINGKCKDHSWNNGEVTKKATCKATGVKTYTCTTCNETKTETIAKTAHTYKTTTTKAATKKNGSKITKCSVCGAKKSTTTIYYPKTITLSKTSYVYNGKAKKPSVTVKDSKGKKIAASNYTVSYPSGRKNVGTYTATIKFKGNYSGTVKKTFTIKPKATTLSSVTAGKKKFTAKWKKQATQTTGYQIQYSTDKNFKKNNKSVTVSKNKTTSKSVSKLKAKKKYYVRVRTYKTVKVNGKSTKIYSDWSKSKTVTTKK